MPHTTLAPSNGKSTSHGPVPPRSIFCDAYWQIASSWVWGVSCSGASQSSSNLLRYARLHTNLFHPLHSWIIGSVTMVTFRCEYSWLLFCWPMACLVWLALASLALYCMAKEIEITLDGHHRSFIEILLLPYRFSPTAHGHPSHSHSNLLPQSIPPSPSFPVPVPHLAKTDPTGPRVPEPPLTADSRWASSEQQMTQAVYGGSAPAEALHPRRRAAPPDVKILESPPPTATKHHSEPRTAVGLPGQSFTVTITMRHESFWEWYEAGLETVAVGVYLYATIVLGSILFLTGQSGIEYTVLMVLSLAVIRIVGNVM